MTLRRLAYLPVDSFVVDGERRRLRSPAGPPTCRQLAALNRLGCLFVVEPGTAPTITRANAAGAIDAALALEAVATGAIVLESVAVADLIERWALKLGVRPIVAAKFVTWFVRIGYLERRGDRVRVTSAGERMSRRMRHAGAEDE